MRIGSLRHRVNVESKSTGSVGDRGQPVSSWASAFESVPASIESLSGRELETARQLVAEATYKVTMRYHEGITTKDRLTFGSQTLAIGYINNVEQRNLWLILLCSEVS